MKIEEINYWNRAKSNKKDLLNEFKNIFPIQEINPKETTFFHPGISIVIKSIKQRVFKGLIFQAFYIKTSKETFQWLYNVNIISNNNKKKLKDIFNYANDLFRLHLSIIQKPVPTITFHPNLNKEKKICKGVVKNILERKSKS